jgi:PAS domain S-box-containing protein
LFLPNGDVYLAEPYSSQQNLEVRNFSFRDWYNGVTTSMKPYISESYKTQYTNEMTLAMAAPIMEQNNLVGIVHATLNLDDIKNTLHNMSLGNETKIFIIDHNGNIVFTSSQKSTFDSMDISFNDLIKNFDGHDYLITQINGQNVLVLRSAIPAGQNQWHVFFLQPYDLAFDTTIATQKLSITVLIVVFLLLAVTGITIFYFIKKNLSVQKSLQEANDDLKNFISALDESSIVAITDSEGTITYVNNKFCEISKYSKEELIGQNHRLLKSGHHPPEFYAGIWKQITKGHVWKGDIKNKAKDGSYYWVRTTIVPFLGSDGKPEQYIAVRTDITNQKILEENLKNTLYEIKEADRLKEEFSTMVSHELKTPLTPIKGYCEMLMEPDILGQLNQEQKDAIKEIERNTIRLDRLIADILDAQKLDMGKMIFNKESFDVKQFLAELKTDMSSLFSDKQIQIVINSNVDGSIISDKQRLRQVIDNLIKNAVDFVPRNTGVIEIQIIHENNNIVFSVKDNGIGIPKNAQQNIFRKFYQVDTSHTRKHGGTGLGLVVCKGIVEQLGGKIWFESEEGTGTTFYFSIPAK